MSIHDSRLYLAVPTGASRENDTLMVLNLLTGEWESRDNLPVTGFFTYDLFTERGRLGLVMYVPEGSTYYSGGAGWLATWRGMVADEYPASASPWWQEVPISAEMTTRSFFIPERAECRVTSVTWVEEGMDSAYEVDLITRGSVLRRVNDVRWASDNGWTHPWNRTARDTTNANDDARDPDRIDWAEYPSGFKLGSGFLLTARSRHEHWSVRTAPAVAHQLVFRVTRGLARFFGLRMWLRRASLRSTAVAAETP
jgi:hypothetical protein